MKKIIVLCLMLILAFSSCSSNEKVIEFKEKIYVSENKTANNTNVKVQYCIKEPQEYEFNSYNYDIDAVFSKSEIEELTNGFSLVEEKIFNKNQEDYISKLVFSDTKKDLDERQAKIYKKDDIQLILLDDVFFYVLPSCPFCNTEKEHNESAEASKKHFEEIIKTIGINNYKSDEYSFSPYAHSEKSNSQTGENVKECEFYAFKLYDGIIYTDVSFAYLHDEEYCVFAGAKQKISKGDKITKHILTGEELIEIYEDRLTNSSIYKENNGAPAEKHACQLILKTNYDETNKKWVCNLEWALVYNNDEFDFSPLLGDFNDYVSFDAITGELDWSLRHIW